MTDSVNGPQRRVMVGSLVALIVGVAVARFVNMAFFVPLAIGFIASALLRNARPAFPGSLNGMLAGTIGQVGWFLIGVVLAPGQAPMVALDVVVSLALVIWLVKRPALVPTGLLLLWQAVGAAIAYVAASHMPPNAPAFRALVCHMLLRIIIIGFATIYVGVLSRERSGRDLLFGK